MKGEVVAGGDLILVLTRSEAKALLWAVAMEAKRYDGMMDVERPDVADYLTGVRTQLQLWQPGGGGIRMDPILWSCALEAAQIEQNRFSGLAHRGFSTADQKGLDSSIRLLASAFRQIARGATGQLWKDE